MTSALDLETRRTLLREAQSVCASLKQKAAAEAATALAIFLRDGWSVLEQALDPSTRVELGAATRHWLDFRRAAAPVVVAIAQQHGPVGVAFFLGWLKRLATLSQAATTRRAPWAASRPTAGLAAPQLKAGDVVEAVLLEERTKKGGWKARHVETGLAGPIVNSDALSVNRAPGDRITLVVTSVGRREAAFRYPDETPSSEPRGRS